MSWDELCRRRRAIDAVLAHAERFPSADLPLDLPAVREAFDSRADLLMALQSDWSQALWAQIDLISYTTNSRLLNAVDVCRAAWMETARRRPTLRRLLDACQDDVSVA